MKISDIIYETTSESRDLQVVAKKIAEYIVNTSGEPSRFTADNIRVVGSESAIVDALNRITFTVVNKPGDTMIAEYDPNTSIVEINWPAVQDEASEKNSSELKELTKTLVHELQHAVDDIKSKGKALSKAVSAKTTTDDDAYSEYLKLPQEVNARFAEALADINEQLPYMRDAEQLPSIINNAFAQHNINRVFSQRSQDPAYRRLLSRAYQFYSAHLEQNKPVSATQAKQFILKK